MSHKQTQPTEAKINNGISEDYCSFEVSKLLKEKGLIQVTDTGYTECPTHALAIKWIRENFKIHIGVNQDWHYGRLKGYDGLIETENGDTTVSTETFAKPEQATETALLYTLKHLII